MNFPGPGDELQDASWWHAHSLGSGDLRAEAMHARENGMQPVRLPETRLGRQVHEALRGLLERLQCHPKPVARFRAVARREIEGPGEARSQGLAFHEGSPAPST
jgi:hypothetical protein